MPFLQMRTLWTVITPNLSTRFSARPPTPARASGRYVDSPFTVIILQYRDFSGDVCHNSVYCMRDFLWLIKYKKVLVLQI